MEKRNTRLFLAGDASKKVSICRQELLQSYLKKISNAADFSLVDESSQTANKKKIYVGNFGEENPINPHRNKNSKPKDSKCLHF